MYRDRETQGIAAPASLRISFRCVSDRGRVRPINEDSGAVVIPDDPEVLRRQGVLAVVADGMGGHNGGEFASRIAVERIRENYYSSQLAPNDALRQAFDAANREIFEHGGRHPELAGM